MGFGVKGRQKLTFGTLGVLDLHLELSEENILHRVLAGVTEEDLDKGGEGAAWRRLPGQAGGSSSAKFFSPREQKQESCAHPTPLPHPSLPGLGSGMQYTMAWL